jgi:hypothetical protein
MNHAVFGLSRASICIQSSAGFASIEGGKFSAQFDHGGQGHVD